MSLDNVKLSIKNLDLFYGDNQALRYKYRYKIK